MVGLSFFGKEGSGTHLKSFVRALQKVNFRIFKREGGGSHFSTQWVVQFEFSIF